MAESTRTSEPVTRLRSTRAFLEAVNADPQLTLVQKLVAAAVWSGTETWGRGSALKITMGRLAERITWTEQRRVPGERTRAPVTVHPDRHTVSDALGVLADRGYIVVLRPNTGFQGTGRGSVTEIRIAHQSSDPHVPWSQDAPTTLDLDV